MIRDGTFPGNRKLRGSAVAVVPFMAVLVLAGFRDAAGFVLPPDVKVVANAAVGSMVACDFEGALTQVDSLIRADTADPFGYLLKVCAIGLRDLDYGATSDSAAFVQAYQRMLAAVQTDARAARDTVYALTMRGFAHAAYAAFCLRTRNYGAGVQTGLDALAELKEAQKRDPANADVDFFLGLYECARADLRKRLWWILFWYPGSRSEGIRRLETCARSAEFSSLGAKMALADLYAQDRAYDKSLRVIDQMTAVHPSSRFMAWSRARYHELRKEYAQAAQQYGKLATAYQGIETARYSAAATLLSQARMHAAARELPEARTACDRVVALYGARPEAYFREAARDARKLRERIDRNG